MGAKFRRQHPIARFIVDYCCPTENLVVELDGGIHQGRGGEDAARQEAIEALGYRVIRFNNDAVLNDLEEVLARLGKHLHG